MADNTNPAPMTPYAWLASVTAPTLLALAVVGYLAGAWVSGSQYKDMKAERDEYKKMAIDALTTAEDAKHMRFGASPTLATPKSQLAERIKSVQNVEVNP